MKISELPYLKNSYMIKLKNKDAPHITIETNQTCNMTCFKCFDKNKKFVKELWEVKDEIDFALKNRRLETISIVGGEPSLYKNVVEVIQYIKDKKKTCQLLTNGKFILEKNDELLNRMIKAGLDRIVVHIDSGQHGRENNYLEIAEIIAKTLNNAKLSFLVSQTIYHNKINDLKDILLTLSKYEYYSGILAVIENDFNGDTFITEQRRNVMKNIISMFYEDISIFPNAYVPSNIDDKELAWGIFIFLLDSRNNKGYIINSTIVAAYFKLHKLIKGCIPFSFVWKKKSNKGLLLLLFLLEFIVDPKKIREIFKFSNNLRSLNNKYIFTIIIQEGVLYNPEKKQFSFCHSCIDATIRNGKITPICIADILNPVEKHDKVNKKLYNDIYNYLN